uniref:Uncharacterized protein n=1 Tax=Molossus molossus TaxID=27622 RepID=A0A7J8I129_MOLMO|nr:hypothetical protein HJG59_010781 [Molossus molossus]
MSAPQPLVLGVYLDSDRAATMGDGAGLRAVCGFRDQHLGSCTNVHQSVLTQSVPWSHGARCAGGLRLPGPSHSHCLLPGKTGIFQNAGTSPRCREKRPEGLLTGVAGCSVHSTATFCSGLVVYLHVHSHSLTLAHSLTLTFPQVLPPTIFSQKLYCIFYYIYYKDIFPFIFR